MTPSADRLSYEQEVREVDDDLARLVGRLDGLLGPDRYLLVVTADHGEEFREHGLVFDQLYDEVMRAVLFRWPGRIPADRLIEQTVSLVDVAPTILGWRGRRTGGWATAGTSRP
jgi:arylsulfatase A-like enzyme